MRAVASRSLDPRPTLVVGLGVTGWSVVRFLKGRGQAVVVMDSRPSPPGLKALSATYPEVPFLDLNDGINAQDYVRIVASPGVVVPGHEVQGDIELFAREATAPVVAVTGSNGKSTVTMLVQRMLDCDGTTALAGGNLGPPALDLLNETVPDFYVLELSSFQLETTHSLRPAASVVLNLSEDHMDRYQDMDEYRSAKLRIHHHSTCRVFNRDEPALVDSVRRESDMTFGLDCPDDGDFGVLPRRDGRWLAWGDRPLAPTSALTLPGEQNLSNMLAALALVAAARRSASHPLTPERMKCGLAWEGLPHRCERVPTQDGIHWINDSKGTNVGATLAAIRGADRPLVLIAGGQGKGADFTPLREVMDAGVRGVILIGEATDRIRHVLGPVVRTWCQSSLTEAVAQARHISRPGDTVLFSPACASFDMFDSYVHRGECFRRLVTEEMPSRPQPAGKR